MGDEEDPYGECDKKQFENTDGEEGNKVIIKINHNTPNAYLAAQRLEQFLKQFDKMSEEQRKDCIERVDMLAPGMLAELYNALNEYME